MFKKAEAGKPGNLSGRQGLLGLDTSEGFVGCQLELSDLLLRKGTDSGIESVLRHSPHLESESHRVFRKALLRRSLYNRRSCQIGSVQVGGQWDDKD